MIKERGGELGAARGPEADRVRKTGLEGDAVMAPAGRQVEQVARFEQDLLLGAESGDELERRTLDEGERAVLRPRLREAPQPAAAALDEKYVVGIEMRPDPAPPPRAA